MPGTEIDAIFALKTKSSQFETSSKLKGKAKVTLDANRTTSLSGKKRKKKQKNAADKDDNDLSELPPLQEDVSCVKHKRVNPETIVDPSVPVQTAKRRMTTSVLGAEGTLSRMAKRKATDPDGVDKFRDSRGTGPRRKTEEGFSIYKEDELGIGDRGGDTPLCPFDCDCCF